MAVASVHGSRRPTRRQDLRGCAKFSVSPFVPAAFVRVREDRCPIPDTVKPRRPRSPVRQGPPPRRPEYDYFHDVDYLDYLDSGRNDYFDYFDDVDYFRSESKDPRSDV